MIYTYYIVPAWSDQSGQCRIVKTKGKFDAFHAYKNNPDLFFEAGIMNSSGKVVCLDDAVLMKEMNEDAPLMAGTVYYFEKE